MKRLTKSFLFLLSINLITSLAFTQELSILTSEEIDSKKRTELEVLGKTEDGLITKRVSSKRRELTLFIDVYDEQLNRISSNEIISNDNEILKGIFVTGNRIFLFTQIRDRNAKKRTFYGGEINSEAQYIGDKKKIYETRYDGSYSPSLSISLSQDSTKFLIETIPPITNGKRDQRTFYTLNKELDVVDEKKVNAPYPDETFLISETSLDNNNNIHFIAMFRVPDKLSDKLHSTIEIHHKVFTVNAGSNEAKEHKIKLASDQSRLFSTASFGYDLEGNLRCSGFYTDDRGNPRKGIFAYTVGNEDKFVKNLKSKDLPDELLNVYLRGYDKRRKPEKGRYQYLDRINFSHVNFRKNGGYYITARYLEHYTTFLSNGKSDDDYYNYSDFLIFNIEQENTISWIKQVPILQKLKNDEEAYGGCSAMLTKEDKLVLLFNEHKKNLNTAFPDKAKKINGRNGKNAMFTIDEDGNASKKPLLDASLDHDLYPGSFNYYPGKHQLFMFGISSRKFVLMCVDG